MNEIEAIVELQAEILAVRGPFHIGSVLGLLKSGKETKPSKK